MCVRHSIVNTTLYLCLCPSWPTLAVVCLRLQASGLTYTNVEPILVTNVGVCVKAKMPFILYILSVGALFTGSITLHYLFEEYLCYNNHNVYVLHDLCPCLIPSFALFREDCENAYVLYICYQRNA